MSKAANSGPSMPDLSAYENKQITVRMEGNRTVTGVLGGYDHFMNLTLRSAVEQPSAPGAAPVQLNTCVIRGSAITNIESFE